MRAHQQHRYSPYLTHRATFTTLPKTGQTLCTGRTKLLLRCQISLFGQGDRCFVLSGYVAIILSRRINIIMSVGSIIACLAHLDTHRTEITLSFLPAPRPVCRVTSSWRQHVTSHVAQRQVNAAKFYFILQLFSICNKVYHFQY